MTGPDVPGVARFAFAFDAGFRICELPLAVTPRRCSVEVAASTFAARFGMWRVETPLANISCASVTGPFSWWKVLGAPRVSLVDKDVTFATTAAKGVCIEFREPVPNVYPFIRSPHPGLTVTVDDPERLRALLASRTKSVG